MVGWCFSCSIWNSFINLFWALFGLTPLSTVREGDIQPFTKLVGEGLLAAYHALAIIMLINMLIAMMSNSFQNIEVGPASAANIMAAVGRCSKSIVSILHVLPTLLLLLLLSCCSSVHPHYHERPDLVAIATMHLVRRPSLGCFFFYFFHHAPL